MYRISLYVSIVRMLKNGFKIAPFILYSALSFFLHALPPTSSCLLFPREGEAGKERGKLGSGAAAAAAATKNNAAAAEIKVGQAFTPLL